MRFHPVEKTEWVERPAEDTPENRRWLDGCMALYQITTIAAGLRSYVMEIMRIHGLWALRGHRRWADFCGAELKIPERTAWRMVQEGKAAYELVPKAVTAAVYDALATTDKLAVLLPILTCEIPKPIQDRTLLAAVARAPPGQRRAVYDTAVARGVQDDPRAVREIALAAKAEVDTHSGVGLHGRSTKPVAAQLPVAAGRADHARTLLSAGEALAELADQLGAGQWNDPQHTYLSETIRSLKTARDKLKKTIGR